jgi:DNA polymerase-3 subunit beta
MKVLCDREQLSLALGMVSGVVPARSPKPVLQNVKFVVDLDEGSTIMGTDLEVGIRYQVAGVRIDQPGSVILPLQRLSSILRTSRDQEVAIETDDTHLTVRGLHAEFKLGLDDPESFPEPPNFGASEYFSVRASDLRRLIRRTSFATDPDNARYALSGVLTELTPETIRMVGTDGRRLAYQEAPAQAENSATAPAMPPVIPVKALRLLERNLDDDVPVHIAVQAGTAVLVRTDRATIYSRLVEGRFPRYQDVFPSRHEIRVPMEVAELLSAVEQAAIVTNKDSRGVDFRFGSGTLRLNSQTADVGSSTIDMPIRYDGKEVRIKFDAVYLLEALRTLDPGQAVYAELIDGKNAAVFKTDDLYTYVVMPMNRDGD